MTWDGLYTSAADQLRLLPGQAAEVLAEWARICKLWRVRERCLACPPARLASCLPAPCLCLRSAPFPACLTGLSSAPSPSPPQAPSADFWASTANQRALALLFLRLAELARVPPLDEPRRPGVHTQVGGSHEGSAAPRAAGSDTLCFHAPRLC